MSDSVTWTTYEDDCESDSDKSFTCRLEETQLENDSEGSLSDNYDDDDYSFNNDSKNFENNNNNSSNNNNNSDDESDYGDQNSSRNAFNELMNNCAKIFDRSVFITE